MPPETSGDDAPLIFTIQKGETLVAQTQKNRLQLWWERLPPAGQWGWIAGSLLALAVIIVGGGTLLNSKHKPVVASVPQKTNALLLDRMAGAEEQLAAKTADKGLNPALEKVAERMRQFDARVVAIETRAKALEDKKFDFDKFGEELNKRVVIPF